MVYISQLLFCTLFCAGTLCAQMPLLQWRTVDNGLPSSQVYQVLQDKEGFIWCSTGNGIARYDGTNFVSFSTTDGFPDRGAYHMIMDSQGRIWFLTFSGKTCYYAHGKFYSPQIPLAQTDYVRWIVEAPGKRLLFLTNLGMVMMQTPDGHFRTYKVSINPLYHGEIYGNDSLVIASYDYSVLQLSTGKVSMLDIPAQVNRRFLRVFSSGPSQVLLTSDHGFYQLEHNRLKAITLGEEIMPEQIAAMRNTNGDLWISTYSGAMRFAGGQIDKAHMDFLMPGRGVTSIIRDHEGNLWFSVFNEGICMLPRQFTSVYNRENGLMPDKNILRVVLGNDKLVYAAANTGEIFRLDSTQAVQVGKLALEHPAAEVITAWYTASDILFSTGFVFCHLQDGTLIPCDAEMRKQLQYNIIAPSQPGRWIFPCYVKEGVEIREYDESTKEVQTCWRPDPGKIFKYNVCTALLNHDRSGGYWMGTRDGPVYLAAGGTPWFPADEIPALRTTVTNLAYDRKGNVWIGTATAGVFCFAGKKMIAGYAIAEGLPGNCSNYLYADETKGMWVCTNAGLAWIRPGNAAAVTVFKNPEMLPGHEALSMCKLGHRVFVATTNGVGTFMDDAQQLTGIFPPVYISNVNVNGQNKGVLPAYDLEPGQNNLELNFNAIEYRKIGAMRYRYQLEGADTGWSYTTTGHLQYRSLPPGNYTFRVYAVNTIGLSSKIPAILSFTIPPQWWQTWWFRSLMALFLIAVLLLIMYVRARAVRKAANARQLLLETRLQALRAQINPHFMFNALNSVQSFIFSRQPEQANEYLVNFARMMRMISEGSDKETIVLREEIAFLNYYIGVEKLRFDGDFEYSIEIDPEVDIDNFHIPPMILQPIVENAFKHGLPAKEGVKRLRIRFSGSAQRLCVSVEDNGTGRKIRPKDTELKKTELGIANVRQRLLLLQEKSLKTDPVTITDLVVDGKPAGLRIDLVIILPPKN